MLTITIQGVDLADALAKMNVRILADGQVSCPAPVNPDMSAPTAEPAKRRGRKPANPEASTPAAMDAEAAPQETKQPAPSAGVDAPVPTEAAFRAKLQAVGARDNGQGVRDVIAMLNEQGYTKVKEVKPEDFVALMAKADELLAGAADDAG